jgi:hypothetical protein
MRPRTNTQQQYVGWDWCVKISSTLEKLAASGSTAYAQEILPTTGLNGAMVNSIISQEDAAAIIKTERIDGRATAMIPHGFIT